jgi:H+-transporting ATPase
MAPIGWGWALAVWRYAAAWMLVNDRVKMAGYRLVEGGIPWLSARHATEARIA